MTPSKSKSVNTFELRIVTIVNFEAELKKNIFKGKLKTDFRVNNKSFVAATVSKEALFTGHS